MSQAIQTVFGLFKFNDALFFERIGSLDDSTVSKRVSNRTNPVIWLAGHLLNSRKHMLELLGDNVELPWEPLFKTAYDTSADYPTISAVKETWAEVSAKLFKRLDRVSAQDLNRTLEYELPHRDNTVRGAVIFWCYHEAWHLGQIAYVRKCLGLEGLVPY
jgi:hypothetical protein